MHRVEHFPTQESRWFSPLLQRHAIPHWFSRNNPPPPELIAIRLAEEPARPARARQVHGSRWVHGRDCLGGVLPDADSIITDDPLLVPIVSTADCAPILIACTATNTCAAIHAGWRGIALDILGETVRALVEEFSADPISMIAAIGPCASASRYEVGRDVIEAFRERGLEQALHFSPLPGKAYADCAGAARILLQRCGIGPESIECDPPCTITDTSFSSHRREPLNKARMFSAIAIPK